MLHPISVDIPYKPNVMLMPLGCIHWPHTDRALLKDWVKRVHKLGAYVVLMGDTFDWTRSTVRQYMRGYVGDSTSLKEVDRWVMEDIDTLARVLKPIRKQIIGIVKGNHHHTLISKGGINSEQYLAQILETNYLGSAGVVRLDLVEKMPARKLVAQRETIVMWLHHTGGSKAVTPSGITGALLKQKEKLEADIYVTAHTHDCFARVETQRFCTRRGTPHIISEDIVFAKAGCLRQRMTRKPNRTEADDEDYADEKAYSPKRNGWVEIECQFIRPNPQGGDRERPRIRRFRVHF